MSGNESFVSFDGPIQVKSTEQHDGNSMTNVSDNPLMSMLSNLGMRVGATTPPKTSGFEFLQQHGGTPELVSDSGMRNLLPQGVNVISAEDLEKQMRNMNPINEESVTSVQPIPARHNGMNQSNIAYSRTSELVNPPPGFLPPMAGIQLPYSIPDLSSNLPQFRHMSNANNPHNSSNQSRIISAPGNTNFRFPTVEGSSRHFAPIGNSNNETFVHSSPFGLGLSIGGLEHVIGKQHSINSPQPPKRELVNPSAMPYPLPTWNNHQTPRANIDMSPTSTNLPSDGSFSIPLENLFAITPESRVNTSSVNTLSTETAPWPPRRE